MLVYRENEEEVLKCRWSEKFAVVEQLLSREHAIHIFNYLREGRKSKADLLQDIGQDEDSFNDTLEKLQELFPFLDLRCYFEPRFNL